ncbi:MAG TPA: NADH-dependent [FeFe] hydrogenase, group A6 [Elusimicrobiota bacterium]|nr:NADH-dependent [FeFe] hydrogenase, group A6 [Elusimicrobiota bacterium]
MTDELITLKIDGKEVQVAEGTTLLKACKQAGVDVPSLCYLDGINEEASCSVCMVEVKNARTLVRSCVTKATNGAEVSTNTERVRRARRINVELLLANHPQDCFVCDRNETCELRRLAHNLGVRQVRFPKTSGPRWELDTSSPSLVRDPNKCVLCRRCISVCNRVQTVNAIDATQRGRRTVVSTFMDMGLGSVSCVNCGQCLLVCPTGAIVETNATAGVWQALSDPEKTVLVEVAPAVRASIGEEFGLPPGTRVTGKMVAALRKLGFNKVFDTQFTADLTIMEEGHELIERLTHKGVLPMITSCSPGWIKFAEHFYPRLMKNISSCKSPQQMFGAVAKTYYAQKLGLDPRRVTVVSIMPCTAKKYEAKRPEMVAAFHFWKDKLHLKESDVFPDVDYVLTTREAARMMKEAGIKFVDLPEETFDSPLGMSTGAAVIFGATGGVMEAALRTAYEVVTKKKLERLDFGDLRGLKGIKTTEVDLNGTKIKVAVANSLGAARKLLDEIEEGKSPYTFIEIMTCPGGCLGGGGQPIPTDTEVREKRKMAIYEEDRNMPIRKSHENPHVQQLYKEFFGEPLSDKAHHLLHTAYAARPLYRR